MVSLFQGKGSDKVISSLKRIIAVIAARETGQYEQNAPKDIFIHDSICFKLLNQGFNRKSIAAEDSVEISPTAAPCPICAV